MNVLADGGAMRDRGFGTIHERYLGSGVLEISQVPQKCYFDNHYFASAQCRKYKAQLEESFRHTECTPWLPAHRIRAEIEEVEWEYRTLTGASRLLGDGVRYPHLSFRTDDAITITQGIAILELLRSSDVAGLTKAFHPLEVHQRWWVLDFFCKDNQPHRQVLPRVQYTDICRVLHEASQQRGELNLSYNPSLSSHLNQSLRLVSKMSGVIQTIAPLAQLPSLWSTSSLHFFADIRKSWCAEEADNYCRYMADQWLQITLGWQNEVVEAVDAASVAMLQSRAPNLSSNDQSFLAKAFQSGEIFPQLTDLRLRQAVEDVVCRQNLIVTVETFGKDVRLLTSKVHAQLSAWLGKMSSGSKDTLRQRVENFFKHEYDRLSCRSGGESTNSAQREHFSSCCYQHVFLYTLRTPPSESPITSLQLRLLAERQFSRIHGLSAALESGSVAEAANAVAFEVPAAPMLPMCDSKEVNAQKLHGVVLFRHSDAKRLLYRNCLYVARSQAPQLSISTLASHIVSILLLGTALQVEQSPLSLLYAGSPKSKHHALTEHSAQCESPFTDHTVDLESIGDESSYACNLSELEVGHGPQRHVRMHNAITAVESMQGDFATQSEVPHESRAASIFQGSKRRLSRDSFLSMERYSKQMRRAQGRVCRIPRGTIPISTRHREVLSSKGGGPPFSTISTVGFDAVDCKQKQLIEDGTTEVSSVTPTHRILSSPSIYSPSKLFEPSRSRPQRFSDVSNRTAEEYIDLLPSQNPWTVERATTRRGSEAYGLKTKSHKPEPSTSLTVTGPRQLKALCEMSNANAAHVLSWLTSNPSVSEARSPSTQQLDYIVFQSTKQPNLRFRAPRDADSIAGFVENQTCIDPSSTFWHEAEGQQRCEVLTARELHQAVLQHNLKTVWVESSVLGSTQYPQVSALLAVRHLLRF